MNQYITRCGDAADRTIKFGADHPINPPLASLTALLAELGGYRTSLFESAGDQEAGDGEFRGGSTNRQQVADELRTLMRPINKIARSVKPELFPGLRDLFRMPVNSSSYPKLIARAEAFLAAIPENKQVFVDRGMEATFDAELEAKKEELVGITSRKNSGRSLRMEGTANLTALARQAAAVLTELDGIYSYRFRNDPGLLAAWKGACRIARTARETGEASAPATQGSVGTVASAQPE